MVEAEELPCSLAPLKEQKVETQEDARGSRLARLYRPDESHQDAASCAVRTLPALAKICSQDASHAGELG